MLKKLLDKICSATISILTSTAQLYVSTRAEVHL